MWTVKLDLSSLEKGLKGKDQANQHIEDKVHS